MGFLLIVIGLLAPSALQSSIFSTTVKPFLDYFADVLKFSSQEALFLGQSRYLLWVSHR